MTKHELVRWRYLLKPPYIQKGIAYVGNDKVTFYEPYACVPFSRTWPTKEFALIQMKKECEQHIAFYQNPLDFAINALKEDDTRHDSRRH